MTEYQLLRLFAQILQLPAPARYLALLRVPFQLPATNAHDMAVEAALIEWYLKEDNRQYTTFQILHDRAISVIDCIDSAEVSMAVKDLKEQQADELYNSLMYIVNSNIVDPREDWVSVTLEYTNGIWTKPKLL